MPYSRELSNKKREVKDKQSRGLTSGDQKKGGAGAHNWGDSRTSFDDGVAVLDRGDPNYDSEEEKDA